MGKFRTAFLLNTVAVPGEDGATPQSPVVPTYLCCMVHLCHLPCLNTVGLCDP